MSENKQTRNKVALQQFMQQHFESTIKSDTLRKILNQPEVKAEVEGLEQPRLKLRKIIREVSPPRVTYT